MPTCTSSIVWTQTSARPVTHEEELSPTSFSTAQHIKMSNTTLTPLLAARTKTSNTSCLKGKPCGNCYSTSEDKKTQKTIQWHNTWWRSTRTSRKRKPMSTGEPPHPLSPIIWYKSSHWSPFNTDHTHALASQPTHPHHPHYHPPHDTSRQGSQVEQRIPKKELQGETPPGHPNDYSCLLQMRTGAWKEHQINFENPKILQRTLCYTSARS